jgi:hypothetical protein
MSTEPERMRSLRDLPRERAPQRDLWPGIEAALPPRRRAWTVPASLAAGVVLAVLGMLIGLQLRPGTSATAEQPSGALIRAALMSDPSYQQHREALLRELPAKLKHLPPEAQQRVRASLEAVQTAMRNLETELGRESGSLLLQELLISTCQEEMRVLTDVGDADDDINQEI